MKGRTFWVNVIFTGIFGFTFGWVYGYWWLGMLIGLAAGGASGWLLEGWVTRHGHSHRGQLRRLLLFLLVESLLIVYVVLPGMAGYQKTHPMRIPIELDPADLG
ncbi:MAG: hypothetical protein PVF49_01690, partial [Anaerolineales bacterium]